MVITLGMFGVIDRFTRKPPRSHFEVPLMVTCNRLCHAFVFLQLVLPQGNTCSSSCSDFCEPYLSSPCTGVRLRDTFLISSKRKIEKWRVR